MKTNYEIRELHILVRTKGYKYCDKDCEWFKLASDNFPICGLFCESLKYTKRKTKTYRSHQCITSETPQYNPICVKAYAAALYTASKECGIKCKKLKGDIK
jgi:hypothetical protein